MAEDKLDIAQFKKQLLTFLDNNFEICDNFKARFNYCETEQQLVSLFEGYKDEVYTELGGDISEIDWLNDEVDDLKEEVRDLENEKDELEAELEYARLNFGDTLNDVYKIAAFKEYYDEYTPWEMEELLKNGRTLLKK
jgi:predicted  nucleic acid-binding Zn-ribbon protein